MEFKELGRTGVDVPEIGLGTWEYRGGDAPIKKAVELGACLIDTAEMYGTEEACAKKSLSRPKSPATICGAIK